LRVDELFSVLAKDLRCLKGFKGKIYPNGASLDGVAAQLIIGEGEQWRTQKT
jgi:hypothetical protein